MSDHEGPVAEDDVGLPKATVFKLISGPSHLPLPKSTLELIRPAEMLPEDISCAKDAKELIVECCVGASLPHCSTYLVGEIDVWTLAEWVKLLSTQANSVCDESTKKTISPEHVTEALKVSGVHGPTAGSHH